MIRVSFNQDSSCFAIGREDGFVVYNCDPPTERFRRTDSKGVGIVEMLFRSNIFGLVGGGFKPKYSNNHLMLWDDHQTKCIADLEFKTPVTGVRLRRDTILITILDRAYKYKFAGLELLTTYETVANPNGISAISSGDNLVLAVPGNAIGTVIIDNGQHSNQLIIPAHSNNLANIALNSSGTRLATASERGTLIRVWDTTSGEQLHEFRRGLEVVRITSLTFDLDSTRLLVGSNKGTVHVYSLIREENPNRKSSLSYISEYLPSYFSSEWSSVSFEVPPESICTFSNTSVDTVYAIAGEQFLKYTYDTKTGTGELSETLFITD